MKISDRYRSFLTKIFPLALPIIIQNVLTSSLGMLDGIMLAHYGTTEQSTINMAAVGQASRIFFVIMLFYFGIAAGASIFFAQFHGKGDNKGVRKILGVAMTIGLLVSLIPFLGSLFFAEPLMSFFVSSHDQRVIELGASFLQILGWSYPVYVMSWVYGYALRAVGHPKIYMVASVSALLTNAILNYFLIYGNSFIPALGVKGAAIGTTISRFVEFGIMVVYVYTRKQNILKAPLKEIFSFNLKDVKQYLKTSLPVILEEGLWGGGMTLVFVIFGSLGRTTLATLGMIGSFIELSFVIFFAISQATNIIMGEMIGSKEKTKDIRWTAWRCIELGFIGSLVVIFFMSFVPYYLIPIFYHVDEASITLARYTLWAFEVVLLIRGVQLVGIIGVLRGSGDTLYSMVVDLFGMWFIMVPLTYYTAVVLHWPLPFVELIAAVYDLFVLVLVFARIFTNKWIKNVTYEVTS